jgi:hypothetical protein
MPLSVDSFDVGGDGAFSSSSNSPPPQNMPAGLQIYSAAFLELLTQAHRSQFDARPVEWNPKRRLKFFEFIPHAIVPTVTIRDREVVGWRRDQCDATV